MRTETRFLASVRDDAEASIALQAGADLIDFKEPSAGALGAVDPTLLANAVSSIAGCAQTSATIGDLPMIPTVVAAATTALKLCKRHSR